MMENRSPDFGIEARVKRLTWLLGPPGAGKSTFARHIQCAFSRVLEFDQMLGPLVNELRITHGILRANNLLIEVVRQIELIPENRTLPPLLAVAGTIDPEKLLPLSPWEEVWVILPPNSQWRTQLEGRPTQKGDLKRSEQSEGYKNFAFAEKSYRELHDWTALHPEAKIVELPFHPEYIGNTYHELDP